MTILEWKCWRSRCRQASTMWLVIGSWSTTSCAKHAGEVLERKAELGAVTVTLIERDEASGA